MYHGGWQGQELDGYGMTKALVCALGLMTGTSLDGVDAAIIETDGRNIIRPGPGLFLEFKKDVREDLQAATDRALELGEKVSDDPIVRAGEQALTAVCAEAIASLVITAPETPNLVGFHGQTILHIPERKITWQMGDGARLARMSGYPVVWDFRSADVVAGGQGAPLAPLYHRALVRNAGLTGPIAILNIGGVANVTYINGDDIMAFDTGPGNGLIDAWVQHHTDQMFDSEGIIAAKGQIDRDRLGNMLGDDWFRTPPPKSIDRYDFSIAPVEGLSLTDGAATLTAFTIESMGMAVQHLPTPPEHWFVCGGGSKNIHIMNSLETLLKVKIDTIEELGGRSDLLEAEAFAYLAVRSKLGLPLSLPETTGVPSPLTGGVLSQPL